MILKDGQKASAAEVREMLANMQAKIDGFEEQNGNIDKTPEGIPTDPRQDELAELRDPDAQAARIDRAERNGESRTTTNDTPTTRQADFASSLYRQLGYTRSRVEALNVDWSSRAAVSLEIDRLRAEQRGTEGIKEAILNSLDV